MKRVLTILCTFLLTLSIASFSPVKKVEAETCPFTDITTNDRQLLRDAVTFLYCNGVTAGKGNVFGKNDLVTRAEFVTFLWRMAGSPDIIASNPFSDVYSSDYYYKAVLWAAANNVTNGREPGKFAPKENVTYQEVFAFIHFFSSRVVGREYANKTKYRLSNPSNYSKYSGWAKEHVHWAYYNGIAYDVRDSNQFSPKGMATRGDVAMFLYNYYRSFQNRYALLAGNATANYSDNGGTGPMTNTNLGMIHSFLKEMTLTIENKTSYVLDYSYLSNLMYNTFSSATCIDICYIYLHSHGDTNGLNLFSSNSDRFSPQQLSVLINRFKGHFVVMIEACYSGVFVDYFKDLGSNRIEVLTASDSNNVAVWDYTSDHNSGYGLATNRWKEAILYRFSSGSSKFISLHEIWNGTRNQINYDCVSLGYVRQNPSIYATYIDANRYSYIAFTKAFN